MKKTILIFTSFVMLSFLPSSPVIAADVNWDAVPANTVNFFYTGVASWEFLTSKNHGVGRVPVTNKKKTCRECHISKDGSFDIQVSEIVKGSLTMKASKNPFEPNPIPSKPAIIDAKFQIAYDSDNVYVRIQWNSAGKSWQSADDDKPDRVAIQMNSGREEFSKFGCFIACHNDQNSMPDSPSKDKVAKHPYYAKLKRDDVRLYAFYSRNEEWSSFKDTNALDELLKGDGLIDLWTARFKGKNIEFMDQWILEDRSEDNKKDIEGSGNWNDGKYTVVFKRKLNTGDNKDVQIKDGSTITIGIAIHDDKVKLRQHYVSFPMIIGFGAKGFIDATKIK